MGEMGEVVDVRIVPRSWNLCTTLGVRGERSAKCGLGGVGVVLLEEMCYWGQALKSQMFKPSPAWLTLPVTY